MARYSIYELEIGNSYSEEILVDRECINQFAQVSGDFSPIHMNPDYAKHTIFGGCIAHGMLLGAYLSKIIGMQLPGEGTIYVSQNMKFKAPVYENMKVCVKVTVSVIDLDRNRVTLLTTCTDENNKILLEGEAVVMPPKM